MSTEPARRPGAQDPGPRPAWLSALTGGALLLLPALAVWFLIEHELPTVGEIRDYVGGFGIWGPLVFALGFVLVAATPVPVTIMAVSGGFLFGMGLGSVLGVVAATAGAWLGYWLAWFLGRDALYRVAGARVAAAEAKLEGKGFLTVLVLRPVVPNWTLSYGAGLVRIPQRDYVPATLLGVMPGQVSFAAVGAFTSRPSWPALAAVAASWAVVVVASLLAWRHTRQEASAEPDAAGTAGRRPRRRLRAPQEDLAAGSSPLSRGRTDAAPEDQDRPA